jgi:transposase
MGDQPMKKVSRISHSMKWKAKPAMTVGLDLGDRWSHYCILNDEGEAIAEGRITTTEAGIRQQFEGQAQQRVAMESGTHSAWPPAEASAAKSALSWQ